MVATTKVTIPKSTDKIPASKVGTSSKHAVSPTASPPSKNEELVALRARNQMLTGALDAIHKLSSQELERKYDLVWFAKYRYRYPNHEASTRIDEDYKGDIEKLRGEDGDYHHGFNSGVLAAVRMFQEMSDVSRINNIDKLSPDLIAESSKLFKKIEDAKMKYPHIEVTNEFPHRK